MRISLLLHSLHHQFRWLSFNSGIEFITLPNLLIELLIDFSAFIGKSWVRYWILILSVCLVIKNYCILGIAWNQTDGAQFWGSPFRDCGPLQGRWLWPYSVTIVVSKTKIVASSYIAADQDACNDALEMIHGKRHRFVMSQFSAYN